MHRKYRFGLLLGLLLILPAAAYARSARFIQLPRETIEDRLLQFQGPDSFRETTLKRLFQKAGCTGERLKEQKVPNSAAPNVACTLPGAGDRIIIVGAHFDHVPEGSGVADNWSGASLLPSLYQSLNSAPRQDTYVFVSFTDEEKGLVGSRFFADQLTKNEAGRIAGMVDLDTLGLGPTEIWASNSDPGLVKRLFSVASAMRLPAGVMNVDGIGTSDGESFQRRNIPVITFHSVTDRNLGILHSPKDNPAAINLDEYYDTYRLIAAYLAILDSGSAESSAAR